MEPGGVNYLLEFTYLIASVLFIIGLKGLSHPETARRGMFMAEAGMLAAILGTLFQYGIVTYTWIAAGLVIGSVIGALMAIWVPMTAMPQRTALSHALGAIAAALVGIAEYTLHGGAEMPLFTRGALGFEVMLGTLTTTGSLIAAGKLQGFVRGAPVQFKGQQIVNLLLFGGMAGCFVYSVAHPTASLVFYAMTGLGFLFGVMLVIPIGSADMPVVMSLLNSYAGLASAATGFVLGNNVLIIAGTLDGFSGLILSILMCKAMNRSITNVLFGGFSAVQSATGAGAVGEMREISLNDAAVRLAYAHQVVFVPGYGLALAQAQQAVRDLANALEERGVIVKYGIHPVAGRMPGHMNVLLAEANVPYGDLYEMDQINPEFPSTDVVVVVGANDVVNPDARDNSNSPIAGMPILEVDKAKSVIVLKRGQGRGFSGLENPLFTKPVTSMLYGDAKSSLTELAHEVKNL
jgi:NAD(P) transhydrogenase subunit beta